MAKKKRHRAASNYVPRTSEPNPPPKKTPVSTALASNDEAKQKYDRYHTWLLPNWKQLSDRRFQVVETLDKNLLALASGAFALTFAFIKQFVTTASTSIWMIPGGLVGFAACILFLILALVATQASYGTQIRNFEKAYHEGGNVSEKNTLRTIAWFLNIASWISFAVGLVLISLFVAQNIHIELPKQEIVNNEFPNP